VFWLGHINDRKRLHQIFAEATVFAMPSICEPFGLAILEAMSHGLPVIGSTVDAMPELIEDGTTGYLIKPGDSEALADRLVQLLSNPDACIRMGQAGRTRVGQQFLWQHAVDRIEHALARDDNFAGAQ
jgi:glycosyltransferase involved in cell wall biosynthesis